MSTTTVGTGFQEAPRALGITGSIEKRALLWLAARTPEGVDSDHLTALGALSMAGAGLCYRFLVVSPLALLGVNLFLFLNWFGDSLDGTVARVRGQQRPRYGFYVDHVIDLAGTTALLVGLACSSAMHPLLAVGVLAAYLLVSGESFLATHSVGIFRMSFLGFGPTELRLLLAAGAIKVAQTPLVDVPALGEVRLFDLGGAIAIGGMLVAFMVAAVRNPRALYLAEPLPVIAVATVVTASSEERAA